MYTLLFSMYVAMVTADRRDMEQKLNEVGENMERLVSDHSEELSNQFARQKELEIKVVDLEKEARLKTLAFKDVQIELKTEKAVTLKFNNDV